MIITNKNFWGLADILRIYGSAWPRSIVMALFGAGLTLIIDLNTEHFTPRRWFSGFARGRGPTPLPFQLFAFIVGFGLVFRSTFAYRRYWEARTQLQAMTALFTEMVVQTINFDLGTLPKNATEDQKQKASDFGELFIHLMSLLHAAALANLRLDWDLRNLQPHDGVAPPPPMDASELRRSESQRRYKENKEKMQSRRALKLRKTYRAHNFKGKFKLRDFFLLRAKTSIRLAYNQLMPIGVIGGLSQEERRALGSERDEEARQLNVTKGTRLTTGYIIPGAGERTSIVANWVNQAILERRREGGLAVPPPIMTRVYGVLSGGFLAFEQCRKIADTPFPFPVSQLVSGVLVMFAIGLPFFVAAAIKTTWLAFLITFISTWTHYGLNELARDLEDPFLYDPNDLPLARIQYNFNERILAIARTKRPNSKLELGVARVRTLVARNEPAQPRIDHALSGPTETILEEVLGIELSSISND